MGKSYRPPAGPESNQTNNDYQKEYTPPVGPGSKSLPPVGDFRELPPGLLPQIQKVEE